MRITSWNFLHGQSLNSASGEESQKQLDDALDSLAPELLAFQEVDYNLARSGSRNQIADVAELMEAKFWCFAPTLEGTPGIKWKRLSEDAPRLIESESRDSNIEAYGIGIVSHQPVKKWLRLDLGRSWIGAPLAVANKSGKLRLMYVSDEPRVALAAILENGFTVINTHLSFIPLFNIYQLFRIAHWAKQIEKEFGTRVVLVGDLNLAWGIPSRVTQWKRLTHALSYPSWGPKISFDYILTRTTEGLVHKEIEVGALPISDHRAISAEINFKN